MTEKIKRQFDLIGWLSWQWVKLTDKPLARRMLRAEMKRRNL